MLYTGGTQGEQGTRWDSKPGERISAVKAARLPGRGGWFPGMTSSDAAAGMASPVIGLVFVILFPFIGAVLAIALFVRWVLRTTGGAMAKHISFRWKPQEAYFSGRKKFSDRKKIEDAPKTYRNVNDILEALNGRRRTGGGN